MYYILNGSYAWYSQKATEMELRMAKYLAIEGFNVVGFYPALPSLSGSGDSCFANLIVASSLSTQSDFLLQKVATKEFETLSGISVNSVAWLHPEIAIKLISQN